MSLVLFSEVALPQIPFRGKQPEGGEASILYRVQSITIYPLSLPGVIVSMRYSVPLKVQNK